MNRLADTKSQLSRLEAMEGGIRARAEQIEGMQKKLAGECGALEEEYKAAAGQLAAWSWTTAAPSWQSRPRRSPAKPRRPNAKTGGQARRPAGELQSLQSRARVLGELKRAPEGYYASVKNLWPTAQRHPLARRWRRGCGVIRVPGEYVTAERAWALNCRTSSAGRASAKRAIGPCAAPSGAPRSAGVGHRRDCCPARRPGVAWTAARVATELIAFDARYRGVVENLLGRTLVVQNLDAGIAITAGTKNARHRAAPRR